MDNERKYNDVGYLEEVMKRRFGFHDEDDKSTDDLYSRYWLGNLPKHNRDLITLASYRRAVARFVKIATRKDIPVIFNVKGHSYVTDKQNKVTLSAICKNKEFDSVVGLALHESSHILWTDWEAIKNLMNSYSCKNGWVVPQEMIDEVHRISGIADTNQKNVEVFIRKLIKEYENYIEDRRIDDKMIKSIPGYEPYYKALYQKYFGSKSISAGLKSSYLRNLDFKSYGFRITNHINPDSDSKALPGLDKIIKLIDVANIGRLDNTQEVIEIAIKVVKTIFKNIPTSESKEQDSDKSQEGELQDGEGEGQDGSEPSQEENNPMDDYEDGGDLDDSDPNDQPGEPVPSDDNDNENNDSDSSDENENDDETNDDENDDKSKDDKVDKNEFEDSNLDGDDGEADENKTGGKDEEGDESTGSVGGANGSLEENGDNDSESGNETEDGKENEDGNESGDTEKDDKPEDLSDTDKKKLEKELKTQSDMLDGEVDKKDLDAKDAKTLKDIEDAGTTVEHVQGDSKTGMDVYVIRKINKDIMETFDICKKDFIGYEKGERKYDIKIDVDSRDAVLKGTRLGKILAKKLQVRNETKVYKSKRKTFGKIDRRLLHQLGVGTTQIFETINKDQYGHAIVHITIDASGSMNGDKWKNTMISAIAIAYAATQVENLKVVISFRGTYNRITTVGSGRRMKSVNETIPMMVIGYDSRVDKFKKIQQLFPYISTFGITPEGLCYEAVMNDILKSMSGKDGYFVNFSDGYPNMVNDKLPSYKRMNAYEIAKYNVDKIRLSGIKILSFFVVDDNDTPYMNKFKMMYGSDATHIDVTQVVPLARELNKLFTKK